MRAALAETSFNDVPDAERIRDLGQISGSARRVTADRASANHFQVCDFRERTEDVILDAVRQKRVLFVITEISEWEHGDTLLRDERGICFRRRRRRTHGLGSKLARQSPKPEAQANRDGE